MNVFITGSRDFWKPALIEEAISESGFKITKVVSSLARGIEYGALRWANINKVPTVGFDSYPYRDKDDPEAYRLLDMLQYAEAAIIIVENGNEPAKVRRMEGMILARIAMVHVKYFTRAAWR